MRLENEMPKYLVTTRAAYIMQADHAESAKDYMENLIAEIEDKYCIFFDTPNEIVVRELFDFNEAGGA